MYNILIVGVGGQGVLTMFKILGNAALRQGLKVNGAETHGMSQRGGSVYVHLRISNEAVFSPLVMEGEADLLVSLEPIEALRFAPFVKKTGIIITSTNTIDPPNLSLTKNKYPPLNEIISKLHHFTHHIITVDYSSLLGDLGLRSINIAALGTLASIEHFPIIRENLLAEIKNKLGKFEDAIQAFELGCNKFSILDAV
jgi:indolepyruvate ferredoxin oxidoreductase beta subunit